MKERIKREVSIQRLAEARGIKLTRRGKSLMGLCPFHKDRNPSLSVDPVENVWNCLGACGEGGDVISWVMRAEGISFTHAVELLKRNYLPSPASAAEPPPKQSSVPKLPPLFEPTVDDQRLLGIVVDYYHRTLKQSPGAQQYLVKRGLQSAEMVEHFKLGFSNRSLNYHLADKNRAEGLRQRGRLEQLGILREKSGHEHFVGSLVIPILNLNGEVVQMYGRKIGDRLRPGTEYHLYLPGPRCGVWNEQALIASKDIILCEALIEQRKRLRRSWTAKPGGGLGQGRACPQNRPADPEQGADPIADRQTAGRRSTQGLSPSSRASLRLLSGAADALPAAVGAGHQNHGASLSPLPVPGSRACGIENSFASFGNRRALDCPRHGLSPLEPSRPGTPISMESPREKDPSPAPVRVVCAVAHAGAPVGGCRADHGPRSGCAARRIAMLS
jgi:hypothetical protein